MARQYLCTCPILFILVCSSLSLSVLYLSATDVYALSFNPFKHIISDSEDRNFVVNTPTKLSVWRSLSQCILNTNDIKSNCRRQNFHKHQLLYDTLQYLQDINTTTEQFKYHDIITMRRHIIIQCMLNNITTTQIYIDLLTTFAQLEQYHNTLKIKNKYKIFHMHFSKAAGTSVKSTLGNMTSVHLNVADVFNIDCSALYRKYNHTVYSRENALFPGFGAHNEPILCDNFIYIAPIREPIERICSQTYELVTHNVNTQRFLRRVENNNNNECQSCVEIDGINFVSVRASQLSDFQQLYTELLLSENNEIYKRYKVDSFKNVEQRIFALSSPKYINRKHSNHRYFPFNISLDEKNHLKFNETMFVWDTNRYRWECCGGHTDIAWLRTKMGSNLYTSYLGYNESNRNNSNYLVLANYIARAEINYGHFINAINVIFAFDHVLPMELYSNLTQKSYNNTGIIWDICLQEIKSHFAANCGNRSFTAVLKWGKERVFQLNGGNSISSKSICKSLTREDRSILLKYNKFDIALYDISRLIEKADVEFRQFKDRYN